MLTSLILGVVSMGVLVVATTCLFGASWGNPLGVAVLVLAAVLAAMGIMALIATVAKTPEQAGNWQSVVAVILGPARRDVLPRLAGPGSPPHAHVDHAAGVVPPRPRRPSGGRPGRRVDTGARDARVRGRRRAASP